MKNVRYSKFVLIVSIICTVFLLALAAGAYFFGNTFPVAIFFALASLVGIWLIFICANVRITYDEKQFTVKNIFGISHTYSYSHITGIRETSLDVSIYVGKKKIVMDRWFVGSAEFIAHAKKRYRALQGGKPIPVEKPKMDIFKGHINRPEEFIFVYALITALITFMIVLVVVFMFLPTNEENTIHRQTTFVSYEISDDVLLLHDESEAVYEFRYDSENYNAVFDLCNEKINVDVYLKEISSKEFEECFVIKAMYNNGEPIISFDTCNEHNRQEGTLPLIIFSTALVVVLALIAFSIMVGRNPKKFSKRIVYLFFKPGYVNFD